MWKTYSSVNDSKWRQRRLELSCSKETIDIVKSNNKTDNKRKSHENVRKNKDFCGIVLQT